MLRYFFVSSALFATVSGWAQEPSSFDLPPTDYGSQRCPEDLFEFWLSSPSMHFFLESEDLSPRWLDLPTASLLMPARTSVDYSWTSRNGRDGFGTNNVYFNTSLLTPLFEKAPIIFSPGFAVHLWDGPDDLHLPSRVYDAMGRFTVPVVCSDRWAFEFGAAVGASSDFQNSDADSLRVLGSMIGQYRWSETLKFDLGLAYLDRSDYEMALIAGLRWKPREDLDIRIGSPVTRISYRLAYNGYDRSLWGYLETNCDGGEWAVKRPDNLVRPVEYRNFQLKLGLERRVQNGPMTFVEVAYGFEREIEIDGENVERELGDTVSLRTGIMF
jgi:hypothetical protein